jgi:hypothetical protein
MGTWEFLVHSSIRLAEPHSVAQTTDMSTDPTMACREGSITQLLGARHDAEADAVMIADGNYFYKGTDRRCFDPVVPATAYWAPAAESRISVGWPSCLAHRWVAGVAFVVCNGPRVAPKHGHTATDDSPLR